MVFRSSRQDHYKQWRNRFELWIECMGREPVLCSDCCWSIRSHRIRMQSYLVVLLAISLKRTNQRRHLGWDISFYAPGPGTRKTAWYFRCIELHDVLFLHWEITVSLVMTLSNFNANAISLSQYQSQAKLLAKLCFETLWHGQTNCEYGYKSEKITLDIAPFGNPINNNYNSVQL